MTEANRDSEIKAGDGVRHPDHGSGTVRGYAHDGGVYVEFDTENNPTLVDKESLEPLEDLLRGIDVERGQERVSKDGLASGEAEIKLDFDHGVEADIDVGPDGNIIIQYWRQETCLVCGDDIPKEREKTCSTSCTLEHRGEDQ